MNVRYNHGNKKKCVNLYPLFGENVTSTELAELLGRPREWIRKRLMYKSAEQVYLSHKKN